MEVFFMLLEFKTKNFKSFLDEVVFSMQPAPKQKGLDYSILKEKIGGKTYRAVSNAVIYGANASGKTNIICAMDVFKNIILRGHVRNVDENTTPNPAAAKLELIPNNTLQNARPVQFAIKFIVNKVLIEYELILDLGSFLDGDYTRKIVCEKLTVNEHMIFERNDSLLFGELSKIKKYFINQFEKNKNAFIEVAGNNLNQEELFLTNGFKTMFSTKLTELILNWIDNQFMVIYKADSMQLVQRFAEPKKQTVYVEKTTNEAAGIFGINSNALGYFVAEDNAEARLCSLIRNVKNGKNAIISAEDFESYGTIRFINIFPVVINAMLNGGTLIVDEFDASIHPSALLSIMNVFHNDDVNKNKAQLIFNTHNPIFLNKNVLRRDEIKFVERDEETHNSIHYALSDFGTSGEKTARKNEDYLNNYFISKYGAIKDIDFTPIFENLINDTEGEV